MKKIVSIVLILTMLSVMSIGANAALNDITGEAWYADAAYFCAHRGITTTGSTAANYYPHNNADRGYAIYGITHALGLSLSNNVNTGFSDVPSGSMYAGPVKWAVDNEVTAGIGGGLFGLTNLVTREQFCVFVYNSCVALGITLPNYQTYNASAFSDSADIHSWATTAVKEMYEAELISGYDTGELLPRGNITRAQVSVVLFKLYFLKHHNGNKINVFVRDRFGAPLSNASVYLYYYNTNTNNDKYPESRVSTNSYGIASINSTTPYRYAINTFRSGYMQGVSKDFITRTVYPETIVMKQRSDLYMPPFQYFDPHTFWTSTQDYLNKCQNYGYRYGVGSQYEFHQGIDIGKASGTDIFSVSNGEVVRKGYFGGVGNIVQVLTEYETYVTYQHLKDTYVQEGIHVTKVSSYNPSSDTIIGTVGNSGGSYAYHLHLSLSKDMSYSTSSRNYLDPIACMRYYNSSTGTYDLPIPFTGLN